MKNTDKLKNLTGEQKEDLDKSLPENERRKPLHLDTHRAPRFMSCFNVPPKLCNPNDTITHCYPFPESVTTQGGDISDAYDLINDVKRQIEVLERDKLSEVVATIEPEFNLYEDAHNKFPRLKRSKLASGAYVYHLRKKNSEEFTRVLTLSEPSVNFEGNEVKINIDFL